MVTVLLLTLTLLGVYVVAWRLDVHHTRTVHLDGPTVQKRDRWT